ncbi:hypothetical protein R1sor_000932 [Riccia sorocarpa]|uniref:Uncharacterized protein n=1 Tax=Riccia sorocarpa TaxID=122646 RepID=A0ABD3GXQ1_9MARC
MIVSFSFLSSYAGGMDRTTAWEPSTENAIVVMLDERLPIGGGLMFSVVAAAENVHVAAHYLVDCNEEYANVFDSWGSAAEEALEFKRWVKDDLRPQVEVATGFYWKLRKFSRSRRRPWKFTASMWCVSREDRTASHKTMPTDNPRTAEKRRMVERFRCQGTVKVLLDSLTSLCSVHCVHLEDHCTLCWRDHVFPDRAKEFLQSVMTVGIRKQELYRLLHMRNLIDPSHITHAQVNYWVAEIES